ncbi:hypothetical protein K6119_15220 [Paracrocinitomix mangrovi]|uniref:hypothetical protein n=1 Tax=Paracrocinitomix mangrovi TaxID=2862509 RepID=UPI001C8D1ABD|nr:hypothetical protein [Paracrocinitomix mangrovi]UKN01080.1 hypothetical protein K6119_15220 [Paracrocinitomix mangrovi]
MEDFFKHKMRSKNPAVIAGIVLLIIVAVIGFAALFGFVVMWLWNWLMPEIFGLPIITFWQGVGIVILSKILFGGFGGGGSKGKKHHKGHKKHNDGNDDFSKWKHYGQFWKEEGEEAFKAYVARKGGDVNLSAEEE